MKKIIIKLTYSALCAVWLLASPTVLAKTELTGGDMEFKGVVVAHGCTIVAGDENKLIDFQQISAKDLYTSHKSKSVAFSISLENCSKAIYETVTITLSGTKHDSMENHIAVTAAEGENAKSIGIAFADQSQHLVSLDTPIAKKSLDNERLQFNFSTYVEISPEAIRDQSLLTGAFQGQATYTLNYQ